MRKLFGGAATADIPSNLVDASNIREVPDHQEVFVGTLLNCDVSVIVELLESVKKPTLTESLIYHIEETHRVSDTTPDEREQPVEVSTMDFGHREFAERVDIVKTKDSIISLSFGLITLSEYDTDVLITCTMTPQTNVPSFDESNTQRKITRDIGRTFTVVDPGLFKNE